MMDNHLMKSALRGAELVALLGAIAISALYYAQPGAGTLDLPIQILSAVRVGILGELPYREVNVLYGPLHAYPLGEFLRWTRMDYAVGANVFHFITSVISLGLFALLLFSPKEAPL